MKERREFSEGKHYYLDGSMVVFTELYHLERGFCCGSKCRHCPYSDPKEKGNTEIKSANGEKSL